MAIGFGQACPKPTKLDALLEKEKHRAARVATDATFRKAVIARDCKDGLTDRITGEKMSKITEARPQRLEVHHLAGRADKRVRHDPRNGIAVRMDTHLKLTAYALKIVGGHRFRVDGHDYWNADRPLQVLDTTTNITRTV